MENSADKASLSKTNVGLWGWGAPTDVGCQWDTARPAGNGSGPQPSLPGLPRLAVLLEKGLWDVPSRWLLRTLTPSPHPPLCSAHCGAQTVPKMPVPSVTQVWRAVWAMARAASLL